VVDNHTDNCWSLFLKAKSDLKGKLLIVLTNYFNNMKSINKLVEKEIYLCTGIGDVP
jgi:hypothetical protein